LAQQHFHGLRGQPFLKLVRGLPGDVVTVQDRVVHVNGEPVGFAKTHAHDRYPLAPISPLVIPDGHYYVQGTSPDSFDSRYSASGLVRAEQVLGVALPIF
jgi:conjugal transfer pilin signal peptidase TrbI